MLATRLRGLTATRICLMALSFILVAGCDQAVNFSITSSNVPSENTDSLIRVSLLIQFSDDDVRWFRDVEVSKGTNAYELTENVTQGRIKSTYHAAFFSHFVEALEGKASVGSNYWLIFLWNDSQAQWEPMPVSADLFSLENGHVLAWSYTDTSVEPAQLPSAIP